MSSLGEIWWGNVEGWLRVTLHIDQEIVTMDI